MTTTTTDLSEFLDHLVVDGRFWCGALPSQFEDAGTRTRILSAAFSVLGMIDGDSGLGPVRLSPKDTPTLDLGGRALHELLGDLGRCDNDERLLLAAMQRLVDAYADRPDPVEQVMGQFLGAVCQLLADGYELRLVDTGPHSGSPAREGDNVAIGLPAAFAAAWSRP